MDILSKFNLPKYLKGKSFSDASNLISKKFEGRNDAESVATLNDMMGRLRDAQEFIKAQQEANENPQGQMQQQMPMEGQEQMMNPMQQQMQQGMPQEQMMQGQPNPNEFEEGGFAKTVVGKGFQKGATGEEFAGSIGAVAGAGSALMDMGKQAFGKPDIDTSGATAAPEVPSAGGSAASGAMKGAAAGASFGPWGAAIGGVLGGVSGLIGGGKAKRAAARAEMNYTGNLHNQAIDGYAKKGGQLEYSSSYKNGGMIESSSKYKKGGKLEESSSYKNGGKILSNMYEHGGPHESTDPPGKLYNGITDNMITKSMKVKAADLLGVGVDELDFTNSSQIKKLQNSMLSPAEGMNEGYFSGNEGSYMSDGGSRSVNNAGSDGKFGIDSFNALQQRSTTVPKAKGLAGFGTGKTPDIIKTYPRSDNYKADDKVKKETSKAKVKDSPLEALRYAPAAMNALQLAQLKRPDQVGLNRLGNKYINQRVDERGLQNTVQESVANNRDAILSSSGGSGSAARANLLASQKVGGDAMSKAYQSATEANRQDNRIGQNFDLGVDKVNMGQANKEVDLNLEQQAAYRTNKSKLMSQLGNDLGGVGKEEMYKKYPHMLGYNYNWKGKHSPQEASQDTSKNTTETDTKQVSTPLSNNSTTNQNQQQIVSNQAAVRNSDAGVLEKPTKEEIKNASYEKGGYLLKNTIPGIGSPVRKRKRKLVKKHINKK